MDEFNDIIESEEPTNKSYWMPRIIFMAISILSIFFGFAAVYGTWAFYNREARQERIEYLEETVKEYQAWVTELSTENDELKRASRLERVITPFLSKTGKLEMRIIEEYLEQKFTNEKKKKGKKK